MTPEKEHSWVSPLEGEFRPEIAKAGAEVSLSVIDGAHQVKCTRGGKSLTLDLRQDGCVADVVWLSPQRVLLTVWKRIGASGLSPRCAVDITVAEQLSWVIRRLDYREKDGLVVTRILGSKDELAHVVAMLGTRKFTYMDAELNPDQLGLIKQGEGNAHGSKSCPMNRAGSSPAGDRFWPGGKNAPLLFWELP